MVPCHSIISVLIELKCRKAKTAMKVCQEHLAMGQRMKRNTMKDTVVVRWWKQAHKHRTVSKTWSYRSWELVRNFSIFIKSTQSPPRCLYLPHITRAGFPLFDWANFSFIRLRMRKDENDIVWSRSDSWKVNSAVGYACCCLTPKKVEFWTWGDFRSWYILSISYLKTTSNGSSENSLNSYVG